MLNTDFWEPEQAPDEQWEEEWERLNAEREARESLLSVPSYFERYADERWERAGRYPVGEKHG